MPAFKSNLQTAAKRIGTDHAGQPGIRMSLSTEQFLPSFLYPEPIQLKQVIFMLMTLGYFAVALPATLKWPWVDKVCIGGTLFMAINPVDITLFNYTNYRGDIRGIEFGVTDWFTLTMVFAMLKAKRWRKQRLHYRSPNDIVMWLYLLLCTTTIFTALVPQFAFFGVTKLVRGYLLFWIAINFLRNEEDARFIVACIVWISIYSFVQVLLDKYYRGVFPPRGSFEHQNTLAAFQNLMNFIIFAVLLGDRGKLFDRSNLIYWIALGAGTLTTLATLSRGGLATMFLGYLFVFAGLLTIRAKPTIRKKKWRAVGLMILASLPLLSFLLPPIINRFLTAPKESAEARDTFNEVAAEVGGRNFFGVGLNNYSFVGSTEFTEILGVKDAGGLAHHIYWLSYAELGILGPVLWAMMMAGFIFNIGKTIQRRKHDFEGVLGLGIMVGLIIAMFVGTLEWMFRQTQMTLTYLLLAGFGLSLSRLRRTRLDAEAKTRSKRLAIAKYLFQTR